MPKINLKDKINDNELDLSMCDIQDVPVKDIAAIKRVTTLDLSNNKIVILSENFATSLSRLVKLDLSQNQLQSLPDNFGHLKNLRELDLYNNKIKHLPLSLGQCKLLRWLDLKNNPLVPAISDVAGPCLDAKQCQMCAKKLVPFLSNMQDQLDKEVERRNAQRKRDLELREAQQLQNKKEQQKNAKKTAKMEKKQKENINENNQVNKTKNHSSVKENGRIKQNEKTKMSLISQIFMIFIFVTFASSLIGFSLYKYDQEKYAVVQNYMENVWNSTKKILPPGVQEKIDEGASLLYLYSRSILNNMNSISISTASKIQEYYATYFNKQSISELGTVIYDGCASIKNSIVNIFNNFVKELPEIVEVLQKRLLG